jgi:predicted permease
MIRSGIVARIRRDYYNLAPFLVGTFSAIFLAAANRGEDIEALEVVSIVIAIWLATLAAWILLWLITRDRRSIPLIITVGEVAFFAYGYVLDAVRDLGLHQSQQILVALIVIPTGIYLIAIWAKRIHGTEFLKLFTISLSALVVVNVILLSMGAAADSSFRQDDELIRGIISSIDTPESKPDIYFFILDMYGSQKVLAEYDAIDNSRFISDMEAIGFQEIPDSRSNYVWTVLSIPSTLNMVLLGEDTAGNSVMTEDYREKLITRSVDVSDTNAGQVFEQLGYESRTLNTSEVKDKNGFAIRDMLLSPFSDEFINTTLLRPVRVQFDDFWKFGFGQHNFDDNFTFASIRSPLETPTFTYTYSLPPHMPFIFNPDGEIRNGRVSTNEIFSDPELYRSGYEDSISFVNLKVLDLVSQLINNSEVPPVIVLQGDHGPAISANGDLSEVTVPTSGLIDERTGILNLMYLPGLCSESPPSDLTSVNTFRFILASCFGATVDLLPNEISWGETDGSLERVTDKIPIP